MKNITVAVVGNPNCGKTTLFNVLTGTRQKVGNWPGVTVERKTGQFRLPETLVSVVDLPGTYSLGPCETSLDERIALEYAVSGEADVLVNIVDASNLERHLYLTTQLLEMRVPMIVVLNMMDIAQQNGVAVDVAELERRLGCRVLTVVASRGQGVDGLKQAMIEAAETKALPCQAPRYDGAVERALAEIAGQLPASSYDTRWQALQMLDGDERRIAALPSDLANTVRETMVSVEEEAGEDLDIMLADRRYRFAAEAVQAAVTRPRQASTTLTDRIDRIVLHRALGIPIFLVMMYLMFMWTINVGSAFIDFFDIGVGAVMVDGLGHLMRTLGAPDWLVVVLANGIGGGIQTIATFIPVIGCLYIFLSLLEDSGYMARAAFVMDRFMRSFGLPGKAFVPLIVGFGCNVPAIMATRTLENENDRKAAVMMAPFMSCGARLPVYALFAAAFFPTNGQNIVFGLYLVGIAAAVLTGYMLRSTLLRGETSPLVMELPPYHMPTLRNMLMHSWDRLRTFILGAGRVIVLMVAVLSVLNLVGTDGSFNKVKPENSVLATVSKAVVPVFKPMGLEENNWPAVVGIVSGVLAKEAVVGTLDQLYGALADDGSADADDDGRTTLQIVGDGLAEAFATIPANLAALTDTLTDPLGISVGDVDSIDKAAEEQDVATGTFGEMQARFAGVAGAFAYLLFTLLYMPCTAAVGAIYREVGGRWTLFAVGWTLWVAYGASVIAFQVSQAGQAPVRALTWIAVVLAVFATAIAAMRQKGSRRQSAVVAQAAE
ncbi:ferrous iron transport protein B [Breoghania corrubedonensis]|uniref:Ferrous iron transport protein B n=1 Tax=Breoghania corrubedonensis TaxID=665038 RepID=A0A2T5V9Y5_9HYPH|nr:Fe(2+) transporter permease subunit FeoB [Breoghania corrubedonensis]PTW60569.1 ferrous iron transport protein B [Breoghania corrubedonensis]